MIFGTDLNKRRKSEEAWDYITNRIIFIEDVSKREKVRKVLEKYKNSFIYFPAARKNHHAREGGLVIHTAEVLHWALHINEEIGEQFSKESIYLVSIFHDFSKAVIFEPEISSLVAAGPTTFKYKDEAWDMEHDVLCVSIALENGVSFTYDELMAIFQAHGGWSKISDPSNRLASLIHAADMISSQLIGKEEMNG